MISSLEEPLAPSCPAPRTSARQTVDLAFQRELERWLNRYAAAELSASQYRVLSMIFDRTVGWGNTWETIPLDHFHRGVHGKDGQCWSRGTGLSVPTIRKALAGLLAIGLVESRAVHTRTGDARAWRISASWKPSVTCPPMPLPEPKNGHRSARNPLPEARPRVKEAFTGGCKKLSTKRKKGKEVENGFLPSEEMAASPEAPETDRISEAVSRSLARSREARERRKAKATPDALRAVWQDACRKYLDHPVSCTDVDFVILKKYAARFEKVHGSGKFRPFLEWVIQYWPTISHEHFSWMKGGKPLTPTIRILVKFSGTVETAFAQCADIESLASASPLDRETRLVMKRTGLSKAAAEAEARENLARRKETQDLQRLRRDAHAAVKAADSAETRRADRREIMERHAARGQATPYVRPYLKTGNGTFPDWDDEA